MFLLVPYGCCNQLPQNLRLKTTELDFPGGSVVKNPPANAGDTGSIPDVGRSHGQWSRYDYTPQLWSLSSRAREPQLLKPTGCNSWSLCASGAAVKLCKSPFTSPVSQYLSEQGLAKANAVTDQQPGITQWGMLTLRPHPGPTEPARAFKLEPQQLPAHLQAWGALSSSWGRMTCQ